MSDSEIGLLQQIANLSRAQLLEETSQDEDRQLDTIFNRVDSEEPAELVF